MTPATTSSNVRPLRRPTPALLLEAQPVKRQVGPRIDSRTKKHARLQRDVRALQAEVARLLQLKQLLQERELNRPDNHTGSACRIVKQYFDVFQRGYIEPPPTPCTASTEGFHHDEFLFSMMDDEVLGGGFRGVDRMIEQWKRYGSAFVGTKIQFVSATVTSVDVDPASGELSRIYVTATANYSGHLTLAGVQGMFPHVMATPEIVMSLIGQNIGGLGSYEFVYDCVQRRVVEQYINIDMVSAFAKVVGSASELGMLFGEALVSANYYMGDDSKLPSTASLVDPCLSSTPTTTIASDDDDDAVGGQMSLSRILCD